MRTKESTEKIRQTIYKWLTENNYYHTALSKAANIDDATLSKYFHGNRNLSIENLIGIAQATNLTFEVRYEKFPNAVVVIRKEVKK